MLAVLRSSIYFSLFILSLNAFAGTNYNCSFYNMDERKVPKIKDLIENIEVINDGKAVSGPLPNTKSSYKIQILNADKTAAASRLQGMQINRAEVSGPNKFALSIVSKIDEQHIEATGGDKDEYVSLVCNKK